MIDYSTVLLGLDGEPIKGPDDKEMTLSLVAQNSLLATFPDEQNLKGEEKIKRARLALHVEMGLADKFKVEDIAMIKRVIGKAYGPLVVMRAWDILDPPKDGDDAK